MKMATGKKTGEPRGTTAQWDAVLHQSGLEAAERGDSSAETQQWAKDACDGVQDRIAALRRRGTFSSPGSSSVPARESQIPPEYQLLGRVELVAKLEALRNSGLVSYAHFDSNGLSDDDLRRLVCTLEDSTKG
jgi:hypothetical protein